MFCTVAPYDRHIWKRLSTKKIDFLSRTAVSVFLQLNIVITSRWQAAVHPSPSPTAAASALFRPPSPAAARPGLNPYAWLGFENKWRSVTRHRHLFLLLSRRSLPIRTPRRRQPAHSRTCRRWRRGPWRSRQGQCHQGGDRRGTQQPSQGG